MEPTVTISSRGRARVLGGHLWVYRSDVVEASASAGDVVRVLDERGGFAGRALYSDRSEITLRWLTTQEEPVDRNFWRRRLEAAVRFRETLGIDATAYRLVHAEGDLLPALVVDRYGDVLVLQALSQTTDRLLPEIRDLLVECLRPAGILARNDGRVRTLEGLQRRVDVVHGEVPDTVVVREGTTELEVDLRSGQKTGLFLDQRENRDAARRYARGRLLDGFCYQGAFALRLADLCDEAVAVDSSDAAAGLVERNARRNGVSNVRAEVANVFDFLRAKEREGERFDTIVLDPPAFARSKAVVGRALAGYKEINLRAMKCLAPGGVLVTSSCSHHVDEATFHAVLTEASADTGVPMTVLEKRRQSRDHPELLGVPETSYLKCFVLRRLPEGCTVGV